MIPEARVCLYGHPTSTVFATSKFVVGLVEAYMPMLSPLRRAFDGLARRSARAKRPRQ